MKSLAPVTNVVQRKHCEILGHERVCNVLEAPAVLANAVSENHNGLGLARVG